MIKIPRVTKPNIIVVPMLKKVDETIDGMIKKNENMTFCNQTLDDWSIYI